MHERPPIGPDLPHADIASAVVPLLRAGRLSAGASGVEGASGRARAAPSVPRGVSYGFTTRAGGVSRGAYGALTLARDAAVADAEVEENWRRALTALDPRAAAGGGLDVALMSQVHGHDVLVVDEATGPLDTAGRADGLVTTRRGLVLGVRVADCVPVVLASPGGVAVAHAGWRGVAGRVVPATLARLLAETGDPASSVVMVIGPHISLDAFEVGPEVVEGIADSGVARSLFARPPRGDAEKWHVDLGAAVEAQARGAGVSAIGFAGSCSTGARFFSWRRDGGATGRMAGLVVRA
jgi:hypothetical protein